MLWPSFTWTCGDLDNFSKLWFPLAPLEFGFDWPSGFGEKDLENGGWIMMEDRWTEAAARYTISSHCEPYGSGELKMYC